MSAREWSRPEWWDAADAESWRQLADLTRLRVESAQAEVVRLREAGKDLDGVIRRLSDDHERLQLALIAIRNYSRAPHARMGEACGEDACVGCLIEQTALAALRGED